MKIYGLDFTSAPSKRKPITCACCVIGGLEQRVLRLESLQTFLTFADFEAFLAREGPWLAGIDAPFGQPRKLIENLGLPQDWADYVTAFAELGKPGFADLIKTYKAKRASGDKEHLRVCDELAGAISPMKLSFVPVGKMFYELAPRLMASGVHVPPVHEGDKSRVVREAYPGLLVRSFLGKLSYKNDTSAKQTLLQKEARVRIIELLEKPEFYQTYGVQVSLSTDQKTILIQDPKADMLDALLCAVQAAWASQEDYSMPEIAGFEGWIADPHLARNQRSKI